MNARVAGLFLLVLLEHPNSKGVVRAPSRGLDMALHWSGAGAALLMSPRHDETSEPLLYARWMAGPYRVEYATRGRNDDSVTSGIKARLDRVGPKQPSCSPEKFLKVLAAQMWLYALESIKDYKVNDRWHLIDGNWEGDWEWRLPPRGRVLDDIDSLISLIGNLVLSTNVTEPETWNWSMDSSGKFKVKTLMKMVQNIMLSDSILGDHHIWNSWVPRKVNIFVWRTSLNRLATRSNILSRCINITSSCCPLCNHVDEDIEHILINCTRVLAIWRKVWSWWQLTPPTIFPSFTVKDIALGFLNSRGYPKLRKIIHGVFQCTLWAIWKCRNKVFHSSLDMVQSAKDEDIFPFIQRILKTWISALLVFFFLGLGCLLALFYIRLVLCSVSSLEPVCLYMHDPHDPHFTALKRILCYVRGTLDYGLQLYVSSTTQLSAYTDVDWAGCPVTRRSTSGYCVFLSNNLYQVQYQCTKHIEIDIHFVRDFVASGQVRVLHVPSRF
nr:RNA-directed DNA polymerase, eukaryota, reverse transcriptase zinc-binding domain protein [Tanacetum cinerariifolium]